MKIRSTDIDSGWAWVVVLASFCIHVLSYGVAWSTGVYTTIFLEEFGQPKYVTAWAGSLPTAVMYAFGPVASMLSNKYGFRPMACVGGILTSTGLCLSYFADNLFVLFFTLGLITGAGLGIVYIPAVAAITWYFDKKVALAVGISVSGIGVGNFLYPPLIRWLVDTYDWRQSFLILGAISLNTCVFGALLRPVERSEVEKDRPILDITPFRKKSYIMLCGNGVLVCFGISAMYIHLAAYGERRGLDSNKSALLISGLGIANIFGRIGSGLLVNQFAISAFVLYGVSFILAGIFVCLVPSMTSFPGLLACSIMFGLISGCYGPMFLKMLLEVLGIQRFASGYGCLLIAMATGQLTGPSAAGGMYDVTGSYTMTFVLSGTVLMLSTLFIIQPYLYVRNHPHSLSIQEDQIAEKEALSGSIDIHSLQNNSLRSFVQMAVSLEGLAVSKQALDVIRRSTLSLTAQKVKTRRKKNAVYKPVNGDVTALKLGVSSETV